MKRKKYENIKILIVDDDVLMNEEMEKMLSVDGYRVNSVNTLLEGEEELKKTFYNIVLIDYKLPDGNGLDILKALTGKNEETVGIVMTGYASLDSAIFAINEGVFAYHQKPIDIDTLKTTIKNALKVQKLSIENKKLLSKLKNLSYTDTRTKLHNYRYLKERVAGEIKRSRRQGSSVSTIMLDIDYFKSINDAYGHKYGDKILEAFSKVLLSFARRNDIVCRYGGEEFVFLLPDTDRTGAGIFAERVMDGIRKHVFKIRGTRTKMKVSMGVATFPEDGTWGNIKEDLLSLADKALKTAKDNGGNKLMSYSAIKAVKDDTYAETNKDKVEEVKVKLSKMMNRIDQTLVESTYAFAKTVHGNDFDGIHSIDKCIYAVNEIGKRLSLSDGMIRCLEHSVILCDLGKIGIPDDILLKKNKLTIREYEIIKRHPQIGTDIIKVVPFLKGLIPIILYHHENFDGTGYPFGIKGREIPLGARIMSIINVYKALVSDRPYRAAYSKNEALEIIKKGAGSKFDPEITDIFLSAICQRYPGRSKNTVHI